MLEYEWNEEKNKALIARHGIGFQDVIDAIESDGLLADLEHPNRLRYPHQRLLIVTIKGYAVDVPMSRITVSDFLKRCSPTANTLQG